MTTRILSIVFSGAMLAASMHAEGKIAERKENQQDRIAQGVKSGELTPHETANLERKEARINREVRHDRKVNGGNLTNNEKRQVNRQQNRVSKDIYNQKHDAQKQ